MRTPSLTDLRFIIGLFFSACGIILMLTWALGSSDLVEGVHINLISGISMGVFGALMLLLACIETPLESAGSDQEGERSDE